MPDWIRRWFYGYRELTVSELKVGYWRAAARSAVGDKRWPMLRRVE